MKSEILLASPPSNPFQSPDYQGIFERAVSGIFQTTLSGQFIAANPRLAEILGYESPADLIATLTNIEEQLYVRPNQRQEFLNQLQEAEILCGLEYQVYRKDGRIIWLSENVRRLYDAQGQVIGCEGMVDDITQRKQAEAAVQFQAFHDSLTGLPNRMLFNDRLQVALANAERTETMMAVMFVDLDRFKIINDTLGHAVGDLLLQAVADRIANCLRDGDTVSRWGGDEFTLLLPQLANFDDATKAAQRITEALRPALHLDGHELFISGSVGIAIYPHHGHDAHSLMKNADAALYDVKEQGRNGYQLYTPVLSSKALERLALENSLHRALERNEFVIHYQPQVNLLTGEITRMEALVHWQHPERGIVSPTHFIPIAEETGLITAIDEWVLRTACAQSQAWKRLGLAPSRIAVNLSARKFQQPHLVQTVAQILENFQLSPADLELEIAETTVMQDVEFTTAVLQELHDMGVHLSMDDFGTGYSSLGCLKHFPLDTIKIDQTFIRDLPRNPHDAAIVSAMIALGKGLGLSVVAEGVETQAQLDYLRLLQCEEFQGYLFSQPLSPGSATQFLHYQARQPVGIARRRCG